MCKYLRRPRRGLGVRGLKIPWFVSTKGSVGPSTSFSLEILPNPGEPRWTPVSPTQPDTAYSRRMANPGPLPLMPAPAGQPKWPQNQQFRETKNHPSTTRDSWKINHFSVLLLRLLKRGVRQICPMKLIFRTFSLPRGSYKIIVSPTCNYEFRLLYRNFNTIKMTPSERPVSSHVRKKVLYIMIRTRFWQIIKSHIICFDLKTRSIF